MQSEMSEMVEMVEEKEKPKKQNILMNAGFLFVDALESAGNITNSIRELVSTLKLSHFNLKCLKVLYKAYPHLCNCTNKA